MDLALRYIHFEIEWKIIYCRLPMVIFSLPLPLSLFSSCFRPACLFHFVDCFSLLRFCWWLKFLFVNQRPYMPMHAYTFQQHYSFVSHRLYMCVYVCLCSWLNITFWLGLQRQRQQWVVSHYCESSHCAISEHLCAFYAIILSFFIYLLSKCVYIFTKVAVKRHIAHYSL